MNKIILSLFLLLSMLSSLNADNNNTAKVEPKSENNKSKKSSTLTEKKVQEQMEREKKYAKERTFYQGSDYNLSAVEVDPDSLSSIPVIEPDYDFDMDDAYADIQ